MVQMHLIGIKIFVWRIEFHALAV